MCQIHRIIRQRVSGVSRIHRILELTEQKVANWSSFFIFLVHLLPHSIGLLEKSNLQKPPLENLNAYEHM